MNSYGVMIGTCATQQSIVFVLIVLFWLFCFVLCPAPFNLDTGNAVSWGMHIMYDARHCFSFPTPLFIRFRVMLSIAAFDALTAYYDGVSPVYMEEQHLPEEDRTTRNKNIAVIYAYYAVTRSVVKLLTVKGGTFREALMMVYWNW